jgi:adenylate cyclase
MADEIERKFRLSGDFRPYVTESYRIAQGYLSSVPERTVRVRIKGNRGYVTIKGIGNASGASRYEWERRIPLRDANELMLLAEPGAIDKTRYIIPETVPSESKVRRVLDSVLHVLCIRKKLFFEVDVFHGENDGLELAEIELRKENQPFKRPHWLSKEVTGDKRFYNSFLAKHPYKTWPKDEEKAAENAESELLVTET